MGYDADFGQQQTLPVTFTSTFIFATRQFDEEFYALDKVIADVAKSIPGYLGEESWENASAGLVSNVYYWQTMEALETLMRHPAHLRAKEQQARWLNGYHIVIAEVTASYGDGQIPHPLGPTVQPRVTHRT